MGGRRVWGFIGDAEANLGFAGTKVWVWRASWKLESKRRVNEETLGCLGNAEKPQVGCGFVGALWGSLGVWRRAVELVGGTGRVTWQDRSSSQQSDLGRESSDVITTATCRPGNSDRRLSPLSRSLGDVLGLRFYVTTVCRRAGVAESGNGCKSPECGEKGERSVGSGVWNRWRRGRGLSTVTGLLDVGF